MLDVEELDFLTSGNVNVSPSASDEKLQPPILMGQGSPPKSRRLDQNRPNDVQVSRRSSSIG